MIETGFVMRVGDADDYHVEDEIQGVVERLRMHRITEIDGTAPNGVTAQGYRRNNFISLFYGTHSREDGSTPIRNITAHEFAEINRQLAP